MKLKRRKRMHSAVEAGALSDILFFLMLFFLMISTLASPEAIKILLPKTNGVNPTIPKHAISVSVNDKLEWYLGSTPVDQGSLGPLLAADVEKHKGEDISVILKLDKGISVQEMLKVVDVINQQKLPIMIATERKQQ